MKIKNTYSKRYCFINNLSVPYQFLDVYINEKLSQLHISSSIEYLEINFVYPLSKKTEDQDYTDYYNKLPKVSFLKNRTQVKINIPFNNTENNASQPTLPIYLSKIIGVFEILKKKEKPTDSFNTLDIITCLKDIEKNLTIVKLIEFNTQQDEFLKKQTIAANIKDRLDRSNSKILPNRLIFDLRVYFYPDNLEEFSLKFFKYEICSHLLKKLRKKKFKLPVYSQIFIIISDKWENALSYYERENWKAYGLSILDENINYNNLDDLEKFKISFDLIKNGLLDIAKNDNLDMNILNEVFEEYLNEMKD